jgi:hypothetical protein
MTDLEKRMSEALKKSNNCLLIARIEFEHANKQEIANAMFEQFEENTKLIQEAA